MKSNEQNDRIIEILKQARRPEGEVTAESLEENLRWLVQIAAPEVPAPAALRQRVHALTSGARSGGRWRPVRIFGKARPGRPPTDRGPHGSPVRRDERFTEREQQIVRLLFAADVDRLPEGTGLREAAHGVVRQLLDSLPEPEREALLLQVRHGLSIGEIAPLLGQSEAQTSALLQQARILIFWYGKNSFEA